MHEILLLSANIGQILNNVTYYWLFVAKVFSFELINQYSAEPNAVTNTLIISGKTGSGEK